MKQDKFKLTINLQNPAIYQNMSSQGYRTSENDVLTGYLKIGYYDKQYDPYDEEENSKYREPMFEITDLKNETYILASGGKVTYDTLIDRVGPGACWTNYCMIPSFFHYMGNNTTSAFFEPTIQLNVCAIPNYVKVVTEESSEEDDMYCLLCGTGIAEKNSTTGITKVQYFHGTLAGSLGCGCGTYGHTSPTRIAFSTGAAPTEVTPGTKEDDPDNPGKKRLVNDPTVMDIAAVFGTWNATYIDTSDIPDPEPEPEEE